MNKEENNKRKHYLRRVYLVSYPKSGNTWMRFLLGTLVYEKRINWLNINQYVHEIGTASTIPIENDYNIQLFKSHSMYDHTYPQVIYMVRDVRDVAISYYYYLLKMNRLNKSISIDQYINQFVNGMHWGKWDEHINSWLNNKNKLKNGFLLVKYEDLQHQTFKEIQKILTFLEVDKDEQEINQAIEWASFDNMKELEKKQQNNSYMLKKSDKNMPFVRSGTIGEWKNFLNKDQQEMLKKQYGQLLMDLGYESSFDW